MYGIGTVSGGRAVGWLAGSLLAVDPLYRMLARRAMSDVPCEAFLLLALFLGLFAWRRWVSGRAGTLAWVAVVTAGAAVGLSLLCKLSGTLALMVLSVWGLLGGLRVRRLAGWLRFAGAGLIVGVVAVAVFTWFNPYMTAHPHSPLAAPVVAVEQASFVGRARAMVELRVNVARGQQRRFPHNALHTPFDKLTTALVQGFGRFGPLGPAHTDSTRRYDWGQDRGALLWLPCVLAGCVASVVLGREQVRRGEPPTGWAALAQFAVTFAVVVAYLPMAWDRYFLPLQAPSALLVAIAVVTAGRRLTRFRPRSTPGGPPTDATAPTS
jgi:4-amino-4-deoxy-L-arabinose transferase-like glycosyltransferase